MNTQDSGNRLNSLFTFPLLSLFLIALSSCASHETQTPALQPTSPPVETHGSAGVDSDGYLQAIDRFEVRIEPKSYAGELRIVSAAANGASVKSGDVLIEIDPTDLNTQLDAAKNELTASQANADRSEADAKLTEQTEALALRQSQDAAKQADDAVKWWDSVDGPQMLIEADLGLKEFQANVDDQQDELNELKKMYKTEELTSATADIVVKRAVRALEIGKTRLAMVVQQTDKRKTVDYPIAKQRVLDAQQSAHYALQQLQIAQAQSAILRKTGLVAVAAALKEAQKKVSDLEADQQKLTVRAPSDGVVAYGDFSQGAFNNDGRTFRPGEKVAQQQVLMTVYQPGKLYAALELPWAKFALVRPGTSATVTVEATGAKLHGTCEDAPRTPIAARDGPRYVQKIKLDADVDPSLAPGNRVNVHIE